MSLAGLKRPLTAGNLGLGALLAAFDVLRLGFRRLLGQRLVLKAGTKRFLFLLEALCQRLHPCLKRVCLPLRSEEHTSELQSLMRISYAVFCLKKKTTPSRLTKYQ